MSKSRKVVRNRLYVYLYIPVITVFKVYLPWWQRCVWFDSTWWTPCTRVRRSRCMWPKSPGSWDPTWIRPVVWYPWSSRSTGRTGISVTKRSRSPGSCRSAVLLANPTHSRGCRTFKIQLFHSVKHTAMWVGIRDHYLCWFPKQVIHLS